ncbi:CRISPR-associated helicase Cas3' [Actinomadura parmotrematis]|uniref:CRISPR-associated helicase Cas3 n=1 Tax=Actinomadura parmotrematis TaxID=2864039 RepID=A0ABS7FYB1_9ACTN|nr:CRISPR-associated helicase Cas3' [Actinomadura parmotrematis]MBW8484433.1 CRISPR-associated helicase Cas3' [Actinomadura parmotrematis]
MGADELERREQGAGRVDARLWGKEHGLARPYPVVCHLVDVAAVAGALYDAMAPGAPVLAQADVLGLPRQDMRKLISFWAGLHDIGKISPSFQTLVQSPFKRLLDESPEYADSAPARGLSHAEVSHRALAKILGDLGYGDPSKWRGASHQIAQLLGGHHGRFCTELRGLEIKDPAGTCPGVGDGVWAEQREAHVLLLRELTEADASLSKPLPVPLAVAVIGIVIVADWLASQESFIQGRLPAEGWVATGEAVRAHWAKAVADAPSLIREAGLGRAEFADLGFSELFGFHSPNSLQASVADDLPALVNGPGLLLVTAPPGDGKTEVALHAAGVLSRSCDVSGLGFCLPTMATTDAMHKRVEKFAGRALRGDAALTRVHSMAWLSADASAEAASAAAEASPVLSDRQASVAAAQWLHSSRRGLLAPLSTFTIDQALTGVLPVRYNVLRLLALSGKVVVIDEAHAYDAWMNALLLRLLEWLGAFKTPVVLLSATLTGSAARALVGAYMKGAGHTLSEEVTPCYPGWLFADAVTGTVSSPRQVTSERERDLEFDVRPFRHDAGDGRPDSRMSVIRTQLAPVVESEHGCVLVCCTTVAEAQQTYTELERWFGELRASGVEPPALSLLHSRFRTGDRADITDRCEREFGKEGTAKGTRPRAVLVATQIVEQSLDLDFDLIITDLAPIALLLQRSGRCQRHRNPAGDLHHARRPEWIGSRPRIVVLDPTDGKGGFEPPTAWAAVYDAALLRRTSGLLRMREGAPVAVPGSVQELVDAVYNEEFTSHVPMAQPEEQALQKEDFQRLARDASSHQIADGVRIPSPHHVKLRTLRPLTEPMEHVTESMITTRLGAASERVVCVYGQPSGERTLDEAGELPVPGLSGSRRVTTGDAKTIARFVIPVPEQWIREGTELLELPDGWEESSVLRYWKLLPMRQDAGGVWHGRMRSGRVVYSPHDGLKLLV